MAAVVSEPTAAASTIPTSDRASAAMARVESGLRADVEAAGLRWGAPVFLRVFKRERRLEAWLETTPGGPFTLFRSWPVCARSGDLGPKTAEGDGQAPEGFYFVPPGRMNPHSRFHLSFNLGYPNAYERARGWTGSALMVHGDCASVGCYAMGKRLLPVGADHNDPINEIWTLMVAAFAAGQPFVRVHALPFALTPDALAADADHPWAAFWANLAEGYRWFEDTARPPDVTVREGRYRFGPG
ncbi:2-dehydro-3-deoxyphosphooctonate aldolase [Roseospira marina]|uniref:2-dehydro-3-deoxyphosphooctonate aldolase n=2 Tax=Roseospira marina TaxID=140057 RepID=A0A5M6IC43_9PROT|nr:2-dehydro-3-deoxyphosphooctonate aldolase [Roseospira marina]